jgi:curved DNA-binding protein CbpA
MNLADGYQVLGLVGDVSLEELKAAYRRLARQYHPDTNPGDQGSREKFMAIAEAYQYLLELVEDGKLPTITSSEPSQERTTDGEGFSIRVKTNQENANLSPETVALKQKVQQKLQKLYQHRKYDLAVSLVESLVEKIPADKDVKKWQAIAYQKMGRELAHQKQFYRARTYLKEALKADPKNPLLWTEVERDFRYIERCKGLS